MDLVASLKMARTASRFVEDGGLEEALVELDLRSAVSALQKARDAHDKRSQVWSAINHLESALEAAVSQHQKKATAFRRYERQLLIERRYSYILALMAVCYRYLGEEHLAQQALSSARNPFRRLKARPGSQVLMAVVFHLTLLGDLPTTARPQDYQVDWATFELPPRD